jgi:FkbM family methyltransferase
MLRFRIDHWQHVLRYATASDEEKAKLLFSSRKSNQYSQKDIDEIARHVAPALDKPRRVAVDIGARFGEYSKRLIMVYGFRHVHAFEPQDEFCKYLRINLPAHMYTLHQTCLGDAEGEVTMMGSIITDRRADWEAKGKTPKRKVVPLARLDDFHLEDVDYMKIDVEGFELKVLSGAIETIERNRPVITIEVNEQSAIYHETPNEGAGSATEFLKSLGMREVVRDEINATFVFPDTR